MSSTPPLHPQDVAGALSRALHKHWGLFLAEGIVLLVLGVLAIIVPQVAAFAVTILIGWLLLISGVLGLISTFWARHAPGFWWSLLSAVVAIVAGAVLLRWPVQGEVSLTLVLIAFFLVDGILSIVLALEHRHQLHGRWGWILMSGIIDLVLAAIILLGLPGTAAWAIGLLVGIDLVFAGVALIMVALAARQHPVAT